MFPKLRSLWKHLGHRTETDRELEEEMRFHIESRVEQFVRSGLRPAEARQRAHLEFGSVESYKASVREKQRVNWLEDFLLDLRFGLRSMRMAPGFAFVAILTLTLGIAANTTIFSWIRSVLLNPLPGAGAPEGVFALESVTPGGDWVPTSYLDYRDARDYTKLFASFSVSYPMTVAVGYSALISL